MSDFKNKHLVDNPEVQNKVTIPTFESANCDFKWTKDPAGGEQAFDIVAEKKVKHAVRFHTLQESAWIMRAKESKNDVDLLVSWSKKKEQKFTAGKAWTRIDFGKPPSGSHWIVEIEIKSGEAFYLWPFSVYQMEA